MFGPFKLVLLILALWLLWRTLRWRSRRVVRCPKCGHTFPHRHDGR